MFSSLKRRFRNLVALDSETDDETTLKKARFIERYRRARVESITPSNCAAGFAAAGTYPWDPHKPMNSRFVLTTTSQRPHTPTEPRPTPVQQGWDLTITPLNHRHILEGLRTISRDGTASRKVRTLVLKSGKALQSKDVTIADQARRLKALNKKLDKLQAKRKKKQAVNLNQLFIDLQDIQMSSNGPPVPKIKATATPATEEATTTSPGAATGAADPMLEVFRLLQQAQADARAII